MNRVIHFEIPADNMERAKKFYSDMFGWKMNDLKGEMPYTTVWTGPTDEKGMLKEPGFINGGLMKRTKEGTNPVVVIDVSSIDDCMARMIKAGSKIIQPKMNVLDMGLYARLTDSEGNVIGIWETIVK